MQFKQRAGFPNEILKGEDFAISYNPMTEPTPLAELCGAILGLENKTEETALMKDRKFFILNGDFRKEYLELAPQGFEICYAFFLANLDKMSAWSNKPEVTNH